MNEQSTMLNTPVPRKNIGHYAIIDQIGRGGMGEVFIARDTRLDRKVALKVLSSDVVADQERLHRFEREAKTLASLNHPNIVTIYSVEELEGTHFLVMELVEGETLRGAINRGQLSLAKFFEIAIPLTEALSAAHERGITHRDLKPENIMVTESNRLKVLDFGLAKLTHGDPMSDTLRMEEAQTLTQKGCIMGTVPYMSPEQAQGKPVDHRSDLFSLGIILYELLTGQRPFTGDSIAELISSILRDAPRPLYEIRPDVPLPLVFLIERCLEKDPRARYQSAQDIFEELKEYRKEIEIVEAVSSGKKRVSMDTIPTSWNIPRRMSFGKLLETRLGLTAILAGIFAINYIETAIETLLKNNYGLGGDLEFRIAAAVHAIEGLFSFERHDVTNGLAVYGYSASYFFVFPILLFAVLASLARRSDITAFRISVLALAVTYLISLPFFILFPVPERWAYPESEAILLSDLWSSHFIEFFRPISGIDNCFPSFHVSTTVVVIFVSYLFKIRFRTAVLALGMIVILSTFVLGIHWITDIIAGMILGPLGVLLAIKIDKSLHLPIPISLTTTGKRSSGKIPSVT